MNIIGWLGLLIIISVFIWLFIVTLPYLWWIYLLFIGVILISISKKNEDKKMQNIKDVDGKGTNANEDRIDLEGEFEKDNKNIRDTMAEELVKSLNKNVENEDK